MSVGVIHISIVEASIISDTDKKDTNPYALVGVGKSSQRSPTIYGTLSPTWNHSMSFEVNNPEDLLLVTLWSARTWFSDAFLGVLQIGLKRFRDGTPHQGWYKLGSKSQWEALKLSVSKTATVTKPASYNDAVKEEKSPGRVFLKILFDVREAWFIPPSLPADLVLPSGTTGIGAELRPTAVAVADDTLGRPAMNEKKRGGKRRTGINRRLAAAAAANPHNTGDTTSMADVTAAHAAAVARIMSGDDDDDDYDGDGEGDEEEIGGLDEPAPRTAVTPAAATTVAAVIATDTTGTSSLSSSASASNITMSSLPQLGDGASTLTPPSSSPNVSSSSLLVKSVSGAITTGSGSPSTSSIDTSSSSSSSSTIGSSPPSPTSVARREEKWRVELAAAHTVAAAASSAQAQAMAAANAATEKAATAEAALAKALVKAKKSKQVLTVMKNEVAKLTREAEVTSETLRSQQTSSEELITRLRAQLADLNEQQAKKDAELEHARAQINTLEHTTTKLTSAAEKLETDLKTARTSTGQQQKEFEEKLEELKKGAADNASSSQRSYENRLKLTFGIAEKESLLNLHVYEDGIIYIFNEFLCIDERASANNGNKPKRLRIPYAHIKRLKKRDFLKVVTSGSLSIYMTSAKVALKLEGLIDRAAAITDITNIATAMQLNIEIR